MRLSGAIWGYLTWGGGDCGTEQVEKKIGMDGYQRFWIFDVFIYHSFWGTPTTWPIPLFRSSLSCHTITVSRNKTWRHQNWSTVPPRNQGCVAVFPKKKNINKSTVAASTSFLFGFCCLCPSFCWASRENHPLHTASKDLGLAGSLQPGFHLESSLTTVSPRYLRVIQGQAQLRLLQVESLVDVRYN